MRYINRFIGSLALVAAISAPALVSEASAQEASVQVRVYDNHHHDYHNWDSNEDHAYRMYLGEHHQEYRDFNHQSKKYQNNYWAWRHSHPDHN